MEKTSSLESPAPGPVFIVGSPRSGTTVLAWALHGHSKLFNLNETDFLLHLFGAGQAQEAYKKAYYRPAPTMLSKANVTEAEFLAALGLGIDKLFTARAGGKRWIDKTPQYARILDLLAQMFPTARFVHVVRDGRRVVHSMANFHNAPSREAERQKVGPIKPWPFRNACQEWSRYTEAGLAFNAANPSRCMVVHNEDMISDPEQQFRRIYEFLGVEYEPRPVEFLANTQLNSSFHADGRIEGSMASRFADPWEQWTPEQRQIFLEEAAPTMIRHGLATAEELSLEAKFGVPT